ncbi:hypothetical protein OG765_22255 [Streptomyces sp. NBC_00555]|uniref:hypothetical protein n=1 Tax=Streptomyces sp. NBC_00555 TaxID=2903662 RepID=UPI00224D4296|nr:hypothetical protein [Streptomyces sp. NBC_00555]MCX5013693.1 hypothetical protein [Streptomyces sp. NBC_00555]
MAAGVVAALMLTACGGGDDSGKEPARSVAAGEVCHGLFAGDEGKALRTALGVEAFSHLADDESVRDAAEKLAAEPLDDGAWREYRMCSVHMSQQAGIADLTVTAERVRPAVADAPHTNPEVVRYQLGRTAWADINKGVVYVDCLSPKLQGADGTAPAVLAISAWNRTFPQGDAGKYREANLALAHAGAVAMAKELGCKDNGGLSDRLTVKELPAG